MFQIKAPRRSRSSLPGSASVRSPCRAKLAATPAHRRMREDGDTYKPPFAASYRAARAQETLAICMSERIPSCMRAPPPEPLTMINGSDNFVASSMARVRLLADDRAHAAGHELKIGDPEHDRPPANEAAADDGGVGQSRLRLLVLDAFGVGDAILERERIARADVGEPFFEAIGVEKLREAVAGRDVEMMAAFGTDVEPAFRFFAEDGGFARGAVNPQPLGNAASCRFGRVLIGSSS